MEKEIEFAKFFESGLYDPEDSFFYIETKILFLLEDTNPF